MITDYIIFIIWLVFETCWRIFATKAKKDLHKRSGTYLTFRIRYIYYILSIIHLPIIQNFLRIELGVLKLNNTNLVLIGVIFCIIGLMIAFYARWYLGKNWSSFPSVKEGHILITSGPYRFVRHPIYTGILLMIFGSFMSQGYLWLIAFFIFLAAYLYRIKIEELLMEKQFPNQYSEYKKSTKALIPFLL